MDLKKGKVVAITSTKGGVGKSIFTYNLANAFSEMNYSTLVLDMDLFGGSIATLFNSNNDKTVFNLVEDLSYNRYEKIEDYIYKFSDRIHIISAPKDPRSANKIESKYIPLILNTVIYKYDVILIDTNHILNETNIITLDNSDKILYLFTNDSFDLKNTKSFLAIMKDADIKSCIVALNDSSNLDKRYFSLYDIKNIIKHNVDYIIPRSMYIKVIDKYIMDNKKFTYSKKDLSLMKSIALSLLDKEAKK